MIEAAKPWRAPA